MSKLREVMKEQATMKQLLQDARPFIQEEHDIVNEILAEMNGKMSSSCIVSIKNRLDQLVSILKRIDAASGGKDTKC